MSKLANFFPSELEGSYRSVEWRLKNKMYEMTQAKLAMAHKLICKASYMVNTLLSFEEKPA